MALLNVNKQRTLPARRKITKMATSSGLTYLRQQAGAVLANVSPLVKFLCVAVCVGYCVAFSERALFSLTVVPGNVLPPSFWIWTCLTHSFIEVGSD